MYKLSHVKEDGTKTEYPLKGKELIIGRDKKNAIFLDDTSVSRNHAKVTFLENKALIEDMGSSNGVFINGVKIEAKTEFKAKDVIEIGHIKLIVEKEGEEIEDSQKTITEDVPEEAKTIVHEAESQKTVISEVDKESPTVETEKTIIDTKDSKDEDTGKTIMADSEVLQYAKLAGISEEYRGKEYILDKPEIKIGRAPDNQISIQHTSISKNHALILTDESGYRVKDLESKNGIKINDNLVKDASIKPGDIVEFGSIKFRFVGKGEIFTPETLETPSKGKTEKNLIQKVLNKKTVGILAALILIIVIIKVGSQKREETERKKAALELTKEEKEETERLISEYLTMAGDLKKSRQWDKLIQNSNKILALNPGNKEAIEYQELAKAELKTEKQFDNAMSLFQEGSYEEAIAQFRGIGNSSSYYSDARQKILEAEEKIEDMKKKMAMDKEKYLAMKSLEELKQKENQARSIINKSKKAYILGNIKEAKKELGRINGLKLPNKTNYIKEYKRLSADMDKVKKLYYSGLSYYKKSQYEPAFKDWNSMLVLDMKIAGTRKSYFYKKAGTFMADIYYKRGEEVYKKGDFKGANKEWSKALSIMPKHQESLAGIARLYEKAKKLYQEGYVLEGSNLDAAIQKWNIIIEILPPDNEYYKKAKSKLNKYEQ
ncbi:MAG: FHA domain-containing protein [Thermodesulfobacteriota bacterium]|nr:FHA domain-containing protein [Thermodesulfobacteriota bacterium]